MRRHEPWSPCNRDGCEVAPGVLQSGELGPRSKLRSEAVGRPHVSRETSRPVWSRANGPTAAPESIEGERRVERGYRCEDRCAGAIEERPPASNHGDNRAPLRLTSERPAERGYALERTSSPHDQAGLRTGVSSLFQISHATDSEASRPASVFDAPPTRSHAALFHVKRLAISSQRVAPSGRTRLGTAWGATARATPVGRDGGHRAPHCFT